MKTIQFTLILLCTTLASFAQIGIGNTNPKATLDITASNTATPSNTDGILIPKIDNFPATNPGADQNGMLVFVTGNGTPTKGFYYWDNTLTSWISVIGTKNTLEQAYNEGGAGAGKNINASDGAIRINGTDGLLVTGTLNSGNAIDTEIKGAGIRMFFNPRTGSFRAGEVNGTQWNHTNLGQRSVAFGNNNTASGNSSTALGANNVSSGNRSLTVGDDSVASGQNSVTMGEENDALNNNTFAQGYRSTASGNVAVAMGLQNNAPSWGEMTVGTFATTYTQNSSTSWNTSDRVFTVGNGAGTSLRSNALIIYKNGLININDAYNLPLADGANGQVLTTDGAGNLSFQNASGGSGAERINDLLDGKSDNDGSQNGSSIFLGIGAGANDDMSNNFNVGIGFESLTSNTSGNQNTAIGYHSLRTNTTGGFNTAVGLSVLYSNTTGDFNTALGHTSLSNNTTGDNNTAVGQASLRENTIGNQNTAIGEYAMERNTEGNQNSAIGTYSLRDNNTGNRNTSIGNFSLQYNTTGSDNVALGCFSGRNETGSDKLYIENTDANPDNALIYGEFGTDNTTTGNVLRTNSEFQIGNPTATGYSFPTSDGTANQVLTTDGAGNVSFQNANTGNDWSLTGNAGTTNGHFIGTTDNRDIDFRTNNSNKMRLTTQGQLEFLNTGSSIFIGRGAGDNDDLTTKYNTFIGTDSGNLNTTGYNNTAIGRESLLTNTTGAINVAVGTSALRSNTTGTTNVAIGSGALRNNLTTDGDVAVGYLALAQKETGEGNVAVGRRTGINDQNSERNTYLGYESGSGPGTGLPLENKTDNIFIGYRSGYNESGSNKLYIENSNSSTPLIYGTFDTDEVGINWDSSVALPNTFSVNGNASKTTAGSWLANSDARLKKNIKTMDSQTMLNKILAMRGVTYTWNDDKTGLDRPVTIQYGFIAQDLQKIWPSKVSEDGLGYLQTAYGDYDAMFVEAFKAQQAQIEALKQENKTLSEKLNKLEQLEVRLSALEANNSTLN